MNVQQIPYELGRFFVQSRSRADVTHTVDLQYVEEGHRTPRAMCGCEECMAKNHPVCPHILAVVDYERERLSL